MNCDEVKNLLDGALDFHKIIRESRALEAHVKKCRACAREVHLLEMLSNALGGYEPESAVPDILPKVIGRLPEIRNQMLLRKQLFRQMVLELCVEIIIFIGIFVGLLWSYKIGLLNVFLNRAAIWVNMKYESFMSTVSTEAFKHSARTLLATGVLLALGYLISEAIFFLFERLKPTKKPQDC